MSEPVRIQLSRKKGWRMPDNTVSVTRPGRWGNPFPVEPGWGRQRAVQLYRHMLSGGWSPAWVEDLIDEDAETVYTTMQAWRRRLGRGHPRDWARDLRGKNLACWCPLDQACHADALLEIANPRDRFTCGHLRVPEVSPGCIVCATPKESPEP